MVLEVTRLPGSYQEALEDTVTPKRPDVVGTEKWGTSVHERRPGWPQADEDGRKLVHCRKAT